MILIDFIYYLLTGWRAVRSFGCPIPYAAVLCKFDKPVVNKKKIVTGYYMPETNRFVYRDKDGAVRLSRAIFKTTDVNYNHVADAFFMMETKNTVLYWKKY